MARWASTVTDQLVPYLRPQESGGHAGVRWLELGGAGSGGLRIDLDRPRQVSALHVSRRRSGRGDPRRRGPPAARDVRPRSTRPIAASARRAAGRTPCPSTSSAPAPTNGAGRSGLRSRRHDDDRMGRRRPPVPPRERPPQLRDRHPRERLARVSSTWDRRWPRVGRTAIWRCGRSAASRTGLGDPVALDYPTPGGGDFRVPALVVGAAGRLDRARARLPRPPDPRREAADRRAAGDVRRGGRRGGDARGRPRRCADPGSSSRLSYTIFRDVARDRPERPDPERRRATRPADRRAMSLVVDLPDADWDLVHLAGAWARERHVVERRLAPGRQSISSNRGASSAAHNPFVAPRAGRRRPRRTARRSASPSSTPATSSPRSRSSRTARPALRIGINPETFGWALEPGRRVRAAGGRPRPHDRRPRRDERRLPSACSASGSPAATGATGRGRSSSTTGRAPTSTSTRSGSSRSRPSPATSGSSCSSSTTAGSGSATTTRPRSATGSSIGASSRTGSTASPAGSTELGLRFGLWIEPEMVSERSELFAAHPDWAIGIPGRPRTESRQQLVLDLGTAGGRRPPRRRAVGDVLGSAPISYVKWDMNRWITEPWSAALPADRQGEFFHRYILGVYELYRRLTTRVPGDPVRVVRERRRAVRRRACSPSRRRPGRATTPTRSSACAIQWGTSLAYPLSSMGAHVSAVPNHQTGRLTPLATRAAVAFFGVFGYELDPTALSDGGAGGGPRPGRVLPGASRAAPARAVRPPPRPVRGRRQHDRLDGRRRRPVAGDRRLLPRPEPAGPGVPS